MTLDRSLVATCNRCGAQHVFGSNNDHEVKVALKQMGWAHVVDAGGRELLCRSCMDALDATTRARAVSRANGRLVPYTLAHVRYRPGCTTCPGCGDLVDFAEMYYAPFAKEHPANYRCVVCCIAIARRRGYDATPDELRPTTEVTNGEEQLAIPGI